MIFFAAYRVTPFVGVWIETCVSASRAFLRASHPSWVCGLKPENGNYRLSLSAVTPFVGVWIETIGMQQTFRCEVSHPSWVCGLKPKLLVLLSNQKGHTLRGCVD